MPKMVLALVVTLLAPHLAAGALSCPGSGGIPAMCCDTLIDGPPVQEQYIRGKMVEKAPSSLTKMKEVSSSEPLSLPKCLDFCQTLAGVSGLSRDTATVDSLERCTCYTWASDVDDTADGIVCAIRHHFTKQHIKSCEEGKTQHNYPCKNSFDGNLVNRGGWAFGGGVNLNVWLKINLELATVAFLELLFYHDDGHIWKDFETNFKSEGELVTSVDLTINVESAYKVSGSRIIIGSSPGKGAEYKISFRPIPRIDEIIFRVFDTFAGDGNAVLTEVLVYGTQSGQFASTTRDHLGRYLVAGRDNVLTAVTTSSPPAAQFEMEPLSGGLLAWRNINKLYLACGTDGTVSFATEASDDADNHITMEKQLPHSEKGDLNYLFSLIYLRIFYYI